MSGNAATVQIQFPKEGFYLYNEGQNLGPFSMDQVLQKFDSGVVTRTTPLWFPGLANWITIADLPDLDRRGPVAKEIPLPEKGRFDDIIVQLKTHPMSLRPHSVKSLVSNEDLRRTDMVYDEGTKKWIRADQHPVVRAFFSMPGGPNPLPEAAKAEVKPAEAEVKAAEVKLPEAKPAASASSETAAKSAAATLRGGAAAEAVEAKGKKSKTLWIALVAIGLVLLGILVWLLLPMLTKVATAFKSPAQVAPASFMALPVDDSLNKAN